MEIQKQSFRSQKGITAKPKEGAAVSTVTQRVAIKPKPSTTVPSNPVEPIARNEAEQSLLTNQTLRPKMPVQQGTDLPTQFLGVTPMWSIRHQRKKNAVGESVVIQVFPAGVNLFHQAFKTTFWVPLPIDEIYTKPNKKRKKHKKETARFSPI